MPLTVPLDRTLAVNCQKAFGRLRGLLRHRPVPIADVIPQARECGRAAYAAEMRLDMMVEILAGLPLLDAYHARSLPEAMIDAAVEAYLAAAERPAVGVGV